MASKEQSVTLLRRNKRAQVEALNSLGFNLAEGARAADFPAYVKWGAGLLDVTVAANRKSDNKKFFFTTDEWQSLSSTEQDLFLLRGVRVRAWSASFIIAPDNITGKVWGSSHAVPDAHSFSAKKDLYKYFDCAGGTDAVLDAYDGVSSGGVIGAPAAEAARAYKAYTADRDGYEDDTAWSLPTLAQLNIMFRFRAEIEAVIASVWSSDFKFLPQRYWSCCNWDNSQAYRINFDSGSAYVDNKATNTGVVRPTSLT